MRNIKIISTFVILISLWILASCHSRGINRILITPDNIAINIGETQQYKATAIYSNGDTKDITTNVVWNSSDTSVATFPIISTFENSGIATGQSFGTSYITAQYNTIQSNSILLTIAPNYAYISNLFGNSVSRCIFNQTTGMLDDCIPFTKAGIFGFPTGIAIESFNGTSFLFTSQNGGGLGTTVTQNTIEPNTGLLTNTIVMPQSFQGPAGLLIHYARNQNNALTPYAYVANNLSGTVSKCEINPTNGIFIDCVDSGFFIPPPAPQAMALTLSAMDMSNGRSYFYIADSINTGPFPYIIKCAFTKDGNLSECELQITGTVGIDTSTDIVFIKINGTQYAYITQNTSQRISRCKVDETNGSLIECNYAGSQVLPAPFGINTLEIGSNTFLYVTNPLFAGGDDTIQICSLDTNLTSATYLDIVGCNNSGATTLASPIDIIFK